MSIKKYQDSLMPNNWKIYKLEEIVDQDRGISYGIVQPGPYDPKGIPIIKVNNLTNTSINTKELHFVSPVVEKKYLRTRLKGGELLLSLVGTLGEVFHVPNDMIGMNVVRALAVLPVLDKFSPKWVEYWLKSPLTQNTLEQIATTSVQATINLKELRKIEIPFPSKEEREAIANILSAIDDKIENNLAINKTLEDMAMALYKHWFVDFGPFQDGEFVDSELGRIPKGWEVKRLDEVCKFSNGYAFKSKELLKTEEPDCYHVFKMGNIERGGGLKANGSKSFIKKSESSSIKKYVLKKGDLLMAMTDMKDKVAILGNTALIDIDDKYIVNQRVGLIRINNDIGIDFPFMFLATNEYNFLKNLRNQANSGVQVNLSTNAIKSAKLIIGDVQTNIKFNKLVKENYETIFKNSQENQTLTKLRDTLLPRLISGEVRLKEFKEQIQTVL